jgi:hypothetical protein
MKIDVQQRDADFSKGLFSTTTLDAQKRPTCKEHGGQNGLQQYFSDGERREQVAFVVKAGQFYIMTRTTFFPMPIFTNVADEGATSRIGACFNIKFVKPDGSTGSRFVPAAQFTLAKKPSNKLGDKPVLTVSGGSSIEQIQGVD